jgi:hypothetical protein
MELLSCHSSFFVVGLQPEFFSICMTTENCQSIELHFHTVRLDSKYRIHGPILKSEMHILSLQVIKALLVLADQTNIRVDGAVVLAHILLCQ